MKPREQLVLCFKVKQNIIVNYWLKNGLFIFREDRVVYARPLGDGNAQTMRESIGAGGGGNMGIQCVCTELCQSDINMGIFYLIL